MKLSLRALAGGVALCAALCVYAQKTALYAVGSFQKWDITKPVTLTYTDQDKYVLTLTDAGGSFKISTAATDWNTFNAGAYSIADDQQVNQVVADKVYPLLKGAVGNIKLPAFGNWTVTVDLETMCISVKGQALKYQAPEVLYLVGNVTDWSRDDSQYLELQPNTTDNGEYEYTGVIPYLEGEFKITGPNVWADAVNLGARSEDKAFGEEPETHEAWNGSSVNFAVAQPMQPAVITVYLNPYTNQASYVKMEGAVSRDIPTPTGVTDITAATDAPAVYYNLHGIRVDNPTRGLYIRVSNGQATKVQLR